MAKALKATLLLLGLVLLAAIPAVASAKTENSGVTSRITAQQAAPSVFISAGANVQVRLNSPVPVTATFSEPVNGFTVNDISVVNGTAGNFSGSDGDTVYTFSVTPDSLGEVTVDIVAGVATDSEGAGNTEAPQLSLGIPYDFDGNGGISKNEAIAAVVDYFASRITKAETIAVIVLYFSAPTEPEPSENCIQAVSTDGTVNGQWASGCDSSERAGSHARYYTFTLDASSEVTVTLESSAADTYLYLRQGDATSGTALHEDDDYEGIASSQIVATLEAGTYTIEATTDTAGATGSFTLTVSRSPEPERAALVPFYHATDGDGDGLIEVENLTQLDAIRWDLDGDGTSDNADYAAAFSDAGTGTMCSVASCAGYELTANLDFDTNGNGEADQGDVYWNSGRGWIPIGDGTPFVTTFDGGGHTISNLYIRRTPTVGLFGVLGSGSTVSGIGLVAASVGASGYGSAGALAGIGHGVVEDSFADGLVAGCVDQIGGLVGVNDGSIANSHSAVDVINAGKSHEAAFVVITEVIDDLIDVPLFISSRLVCNGSVGGLVGNNQGTLASSHSTGVVSGLTDNFGGLAGENSGAITDSYATGNVSGKGPANLGGLVGENQAEGKIISSYATGAVSGQGDNFGGLAGVNSGAITDTYATGNVSGSGYADVGGLVGDNRNTGVITAAYAQGSVSGSADSYGGLLGSNQGVVTVCFSTGAVPRNGGGLIDSNGNNGTVANCYWDTETSGQANSDGGIGKTTQELQSPAGYTGIYAAWNVDLDGDATVDDPWGFGTPTQYPTLKGRGTAPDPDLVVDTLTLSGPAAGVSFTLSARVRNQGTVASGATTLHYYRSTDSNITTSDTQVGTDSVSGLAAFGVSAQSVGVTVTAPDIPGTYYYYGACVDSDSDETITTNNCSSSVKITVGVVPGNPPNQRYSRQDATTIVTWDPSAGATHYKVYYDDSRSPRCSFRRGELNGCEELAANLIGTSYTHASPDDDNNHYWIVACNDAGCSGIDSGNPARLIDNRPAAPTNAQYVRVGSTTVVSWSASAGADYYNIYYHNFFSSSCPGFCEELASNVVGTSYTHTSPDTGRNYYWVTACNSAGCSDIDGGNPATLDE